MRLIEPDELLGFWNVLASHSISSEDFELQERDLTDPKSDELLPMKGYVVVRRRSNNIAMDYATGDGSSWVRAFEKDLHGGCFG
jgi:hypothetical protein